MFCLSYNLRLTFRTQCKRDAAHARQIFFLPPPRDYRWPLFCSQQAISFVCFSRGETLSLFFFCCVFSKLVITVTKRMSSYSILKICSKPSRVLFYMSRIENIIMLLVYLQLWPVVICIPFPSEWPKSTDWFKLIQWSRCPSYSHFRIFISKLHFKIYGNRSHF